jgi:hypothetical protein
MVTCSPRNSRKTLGDTIFFAPQRVGLYSVLAMNKRSVQKRPAKASRNQVARKAAARRISGKSEAAKRISSAKLAKPSKPARAPAVPSAAIPAAAMSAVAMSAAAMVTTAMPAAAMPAATAAVATVSPAKAIAMPGPALRTHRFRVGETVLYTSSPITRPGANGTYKVVKLLPSDGDDYQYRIKNSDEAFERVARESQLETEPS